MNLEFTKKNTAYLTDKIKIMTREISIEQQIKKDVESFFKDKNITHSIDDWNFLFEGNKFYFWRNKYMPNKESGNIAIGISKRIDSKEYLQDVEEISYRIQDQVVNYHKYI